VQLTFDADVEAFRADFASLISFGTPEQQRRWAVPILRAEITASLGMSEPGAGSDLASLRTGAVRDGDDFVVNGQKVWTSGAHDADVLLTFVRTDPNAPKHKGISALMITTDLPGPARAGLAPKLRNHRVYRL
jgi:alkylation response protein AidB-like acyl-CoA dehydrogenase